MKGLTRFEKFDLKTMADNMVLLFVKAEEWQERNSQGEVTAILGSRVRLFVAEDRNDYERDIDNYGEMFTVKVRGKAPSAFDQLVSLETEMAIAEVERARIYGDFKNEITAIATLKVKATKE